jgi:hypothetical protein
MVLCLCLSTYMPYTISYIEVLRSRIHYIIASVVGWLGTYGDDNVSFILIIQLGVGVAVDLLG